MSGGPARGPVADRPPISRTKVRVPAQGDWAIARPRLVERLAQGARGPLTVVTGPPGAGKTVAAAAWAAADGKPRPVAWVSLDGEDHRPDAFWAVILAALEDGGVTGLPAPPRSPGRAREAFRAGLAAALAGRAAPVVLVLDDFRPPAGSEAARDLAWVLGAAGPALRLVLTSRSDPPLPLHRYRLTGELTEIRGGDLAFDERETRALLARHGVHVTAASLRALRGRTEGWAAGLRLAAMTMEGHPDPDAFAAAFAGDDRAVLDYLVAEALDAQPARVRGLLLALSVARRFDAGLAAELAGPGGGGLFAHLVRQNAFVLPLGHGWHRFHAMFGDALYLTLRHERPGDVASLHRRAAAWFGRGGMLDDAARHAVLAEDWPGAARLVVGDLAVGRLLGLAGDRTLARILGAMPQHVAPAEPEPSLVAAAVTLARGDPRACAFHLGRAEPLLRALPDDRAAPARLAAGLVRLVGGLSRPDAAFRERVRELDALLDGLPPAQVDDHPELRALVRHGYALADLRAGRARQAAAGFRLALPAAEAGAGPQYRRCLGGLALAEALQGRFGRAADLVARADRLPEAPAGWRDPFVRLAGAWVALEDVRPDDARAELDRARAELDEARAAGGEPPDDLAPLLHALLTARLDLAARRP
ncbi:AAA family ATPase, partial [Actinomadura roseirufa]|uniref:AAA family ATPase n=1 Tax=Actinomadura roseirufa TaxID=2094049 RepID=UPI001041957D